MKGKKNLERAIILGLILSTSVYGNAWAEEIYDISNFRNLANPINITKDTIVNGTGTSIGGDEVNNTISGKVITVGDGVNFTLNNLAGNHMNIKGNGNININLDHDAGANGGAIYINGNIIANKLTIDTSKTPNTKGIYTYGGDVVLDVNELDIKANSHGIFTTGDATSDVIINDTNKVSITTDGAHGIVNSGNASHVNNIIIKSDRENSLVDIFSHTAGISNNNSGGGVINIKADTISIGTDNLYAVRGDHGDIILTAKNNIISGGTSGVHTLNGDIKITAEEGNQIATTNNKDVTLGAIYTSTDKEGNPGNGTIEIIANNGNNKVNAVTDGVHTKGNGTVDLIANGYNSIISDKNAVYNNGTNTINIKAVASENESTSTLADYNDYNNILIAGENGVKSDSTGTTNVIADNNNTIVGTTNGILSDGAGTINVTAGNDNYIGQYTDESNVIHTSKTGIDVTQGTVNVTAGNDNYIYSDGEGDPAAGVSVHKNGTAAIKATNGSNTINASYEGLNTNGTLTIYAKKDNTIKAVNDTGIQVGYNGYLELTAENGKNIISGGTEGILVNSSAVISANDNNEITGGNLKTQIGSGMNIVGGSLELTSRSGNNIIKGGYSGISVDQGSQIDLSALQGINSVVAFGVGNGIYGNATSIIDLDAQRNEISAGNGIYASSNTSVTLSATDNGNDIEAKSYGIISQIGSTVELTATQGNNEITSDTNVGVYASSASKVTLTAETNNNILSAKTTITDEETGETGDYGTAYAVNALSGSSVDLAAGEQNYLLGAVYANGTGTNVNVKGKDGSTATNVIRSHAAIANAGDIDTTTEGSEFTGKTFYSALYAEDGANIKLDGNNIIGTWADSEDDDMLERTVWAYNKGTIDITGAAQIGTDRYDSSPNSADVAIAAGTATKLTKDIVDNYDETDNPRATITVNYDDFKDENGVSISKSNISGDILSAYAGLVDISTDNSEAGININGNLLAGNNGILSVDLGKGGTLIGRADDYGDAGYVGNIENEGDTNEHQNFYNPEFSSTIYSGGRVDLEMGDGSTWYVTGQSWITSINTENAQGDTQDTRATIDLTTLYENDEADATTAHALTVYDFKGDADFKMNLSGDRTNSDMLYMKHADGTYRINLVDAVTTDEINSDQNGNEFSGLRFATVGSDSNVNFAVGSYDNGGAFNVEYEVGTDEYGGTETAHENDVYNGDSLNSGKPGSDMVDGFFGSNGEPVSSDSNTESGISTMDLQAANNIMLMSEEVATLDETAAAANDAADYNATNHKIIARLGEEISDTGKTILNMSRANYSNAIYMDRLNKRLGEARYINSEEDEGMWVRIRHDRIGKDDAYRSQNTMYELGYDQKQECDNGERRVGMAIDYMHGDTGYDQIAGKGEIDRYGLWLYDTWMGDKGHYADYVAKWGHLSNDFEVYTMNDKTKQVTGDYSNNVFSVSAEYGRKKDIGNDWYFEPQVQAQLARVTGADYTTNQGTKVSVDGINSLIGRAGFRLGKDFGEEKQSTVYIKADVLHEFLGDQDVRVLDKSSDNKWAGISYENEGTWYDVGFGFATQMSKNSYAFMDFEKSFGNDNDETYQINVGMQWSF